MFRDKKITVAIVAVLIISVIGLGIAFAAFSQTLTINGTGTVESSSWSVVFEGADGSNTIGAPTLVGTATEVTRPTIKNNSAEISTYEVTLKSPGDSVTYNFKIHNKGDFAANLSSLVISGVNGPGDYITGYNLLTNPNSISYATKRATNYIKYLFYYNSDNVAVGQDRVRDCLEPGESENVSIKLEFDSKISQIFLPETDLTLDNLGIAAVYTQTNNGSCATTPINNYSGDYINYDSAYYTYEGKTFIGTGVNNMLISYSSAGSAKYASKNGKDNGAGANPRYTFTDHPAQDMAEAYCTGCRLMTYEEAHSWGCPYWTLSYHVYSEKCAAFKDSNGGSGSKDYWLAEPTSYREASCVTYDGGAYGGCYVIYAREVRPAVDIPSTATMTGSGTQLDPYVVTVN